MNDNKRSPLKTLSRIWSGYSFVFIFAAIFAAYVIVNSSLTWVGVTNILRHSAVIGITALGMGLVVITGQIDLSVGSMLAFVGGFAVMVFNVTNSILLTCLTAVVCGGLCGLVNGVLVGKAKMPAFIVTLATMLIFRSLTRYICHEIPATISGGSNSLFKLLSANSMFKPFYNFGNSKVFTLPVTGLFLIALTALIVYVTTSTKFGKQLYAVGSNERAARLTGIDVDGRRVAVFVITGVLTGVSAFLWISMNASVDPATTGGSYEMYAIAAVVLGGISMAGGRGKCVGILFGIMSYTIIDKIIVALKMNTLLNDTVKGAILIVAIIVQTMSPVVKEHFAARRARRQGA
ncbi:MAG: ABC transporter permease [Clostridia bacterium]|nr:ABC transporter permease [Clostridia bacterium]